MVNGQAKQAPEQWDSTAPEGAGAVPRATSGVDGGCLTAQAPPGAPTPAAAGGHPSVRSGAVPRAGIAEKEWGAAVAKGGGSGRGKRIEKVERDGSTLFRTTVTGFPDRASAQAFCDRLKSAGKSCFVR